MFEIARKLTFILAIAAIAAPISPAAENWKRYNAGAYHFHAPASWDAMKGDVADSAIVISSEPAEIETYMLVNQNVDGKDELPDIYQTWDVFRKVAEIAGCSYGRYPDSGGRPIAGQKAIGAYAACTNSETELRLYITTIPKTDKLLLVIQRYARRSMFDSEAYRYALLDSIIFPKSNQEPREGRYLVDGAYGGSSGPDSFGPAYMGWLTIDILPDNRYKLVDAEVIGSDFQGKTKLDEAGRYVVDGDQLILISDASPSWPAHDTNHQVPRRIRLRP